MSPEEPRKLCMVNSDLVGFLVAEGPYPLGDIGVIESAGDGRFYRQFYRRSPCGYGLFIGQMGD